MKAKKKILSRTVVVLLALMMLKAPHVSAASSDTSIFNDDVGHLRLTSGKDRDIYLSPGFNGRVFVGDLDVMGLARNFDRLWKNHPLNPRFTRLYAIGGASATNTYYNTVFGFDGEAWVSLPSMPTARAACGTVTYNGKIYVIGGTNGNALATVEVFDGVSWQTAPSMPTARGELGVAVLAGKIYAVGGINGGASPLATVEMYDDVSLSWSAAAPMPAAREEIHAVTFQEKIYVLGGERSLTYHDSVFVFDGESWASSTPMLTGKSSYGVAVLQNSIYVFGGITSQGRVAQVDVFNGTTWSSLPSSAWLSAPRSSIGSAVFNHVLYVVGGYRGSSALNIVEAFNGTSWSAAPSLPSARWGVGVTVFPPPE